MTVPRAGSKPLVWLPFEPSELVLSDGQGPPDSLRYEVVDPTRHIPESVTQVEVYVPPYLLDARVSEVLPQMTSLRMVQTLTAGVDNIRPQVPQGVMLCNGRGIHDASTAELTLTLILASLRGIPEFVRRQDQRQWQPQRRPALADRRVLIVGYGAVGEAVERRLVPFETEVVRVARSAREGVHGLDDLPSLLPGADVVVLAMPLTDETRGLVDAAFLALMKDGALLVNVARGPVVVNADLIAALESGRITAAVDVVDPEPLPSDDPLWGAPGLLISPHVGGASSAMWPRAYRLVRDQLHRFALGEEPVNIMSGLY